MASDSQQYNEQNFSEDQQYSEYNEQNYSEAMDQGGQQNENQDMNGNGDVQSSTKSSSDDDRKLFIGGISWDTDQKDIRDYFTKFGEVSDVTIKTDPATGKCRGFCFVTFAADESVDNVLKNMPHSLKGKPVEAKRAKARPGIKKIFVGGLDTDFPESDIRSYFEKYGKIESVELPFDKVKNQRRAFCFVTFETEQACEASVKQSKQKIGSKECDVKKATNKPDPRMAGGRGGFGGPGGFGGGRGGGGRGRGGARGRGGPGFQAQGWNAPGGYGQGGYGGYGGGYGAGGGYGEYGYGSGYNGGGYGGGYDYSGWGNYNQGGAGGYGGGAGGYGGGAGGYGGGAGGYGQQPSTYGKTPRRGAAAGATNAYHPYGR